MMGMQLLGFHFIRALDEGLDAWTPVKIPEGPKPGNKR